MRSTNENCFSSRVSSLIDPRCGESSPLSDADRIFAQAYTDAIDREHAVDAGLAFRNVIIKEERCGFANSGEIDFLLNTDAHGRYRVTVRTTWRQGITEGTYDEVFTSEAGGKRRLGCTCSSGIPTTYYLREVVGEVGA